MIILSLTLIDLLFLLFIIPLIISYFFASLTSIALTL